MRILKYKANTFNTDEAPVVCAALEAQLGLNLCVHDPNAPNDVHGYLNTSGDGEIEVYLYDAEDCDAIEATPDVVRFVRCGDCGAEHNDWTDPDVCESCAHDLDYAKGRAQRLKAHRGIYKASNKTDAQVRTAVEKVLVTERKMLRLPDNAYGRPVRMLHHAIDAHERSATKLERKADALLRRR